MSAHQQAAPLNSVESGSTIAFTDGRVWTSLTTAKDYSLKQDGDFLYFDWVNIPSEGKEAGAFQRGELKKVADGKWKGSIHTGFPCPYTKGFGAYARTYKNFCSVDLPIQIDLLSDRRIEGRRSGFDKFDCGRCKPEKVEERPFTWIPK